MYEISIPTELYFSCFFRGSKELEKAMVRT